tara:strand:- start:425 stop:1243 length:819 start_codon:yes stop_codon:yes gene_type:complete
MQKLSFITPVLLALLFSPGCKDPDSFEQDPVGNVTAESVGSNEIDPPKDSPGDDPAVDLPGKEEVIKAHLEAVGGVDAIKKVEMYTRSSAMKMEGPTGESNGTFHEVFDLVKDRSRVDLDLETYKEAKGWQGQSGWKVNTFEPLRALRPDEIAIERISVPLSMVQGILDTFGIEAFLPPSRVEFNGTACIKLNFIGSKMDIYINEKTSLIEGYLLPDFMQVSLSEYKDFEGVMMFTRQKAEIFVINTTYDLKVEKIEFNPELDDARFAKPAG